MKKVIINHTLSGAFPEGFHEMNSDELKKHFITDRNRCGICDEERHMVISVAWTKSGFLSFLTDAKSVLNGLTIRFKTQLKDYRKIDSLKREIASKKAVGMRFEYTAADAEVTQCGDMYAFRQNNMFYIVQLFCRKDSFEENRHTADEFIDSLSFIG